MKHTAAYFTIIACSIISAFGQNFGNKTIFHAPLNNSYNDFGPANISGSAMGGATVTIDSRSNASQAVQFDGVDDYITYANPVAYQKKLPLSFSVWIYIWIKPPETYPYLRPTIPHLYTEVSHCK